MTEQELMTAVLDLCRWTGWFAYHTHDSRRSQPGFPDLVLVERSTGRTIYAELKSATGRLSPAQREWLELLGKRNEVAVWRPADWSAGVITAALTGRQQATA
jgi:hypothetical protein